MPTYGYHCDNCGTEFDVWQSMSDEAKADCPSCAGAARRLFYPAGIVFKGSGFYKTDSRKSGSSSGGSSTSTSSSAPSSPDTASKTSSDSKSGDSSSTTKATSKD